MGDCPGALCSLGVGNPAGGWLLTALIGVIEICSAIGVTLCVC